MRTKVDKNQKTTVEQKHNIRSTSPKVVLNANDCARLLDGTGKTYVLLVEKDGKMVAANSRSPVQSSPATSSLDPASVELSQPEVGSSLTGGGGGGGGGGDGAAAGASQTQLCKNFVSTGSDECSKPAADGCESAESSKASDCSNGAECSNGADCSNGAECRMPADCGEPTECRKPDNGEPADISDIVAVEKLSITNPQTSHSLEKSTRGKIILKPPKKRRGIHKKFADASAEASALGTMTKLAVISAGVASDVCSGQTDASLSLPLNPLLDGARKHSIEHLLYHQPAASVTTASPSLISGNFSCESPTLILPQKDLHSSLKNTVSFNLSTSSPSILNSFPEPTQCRISELYSHPYSSAHHPVGSHSLSCQTSVAEVRVRSREHSPSLTHPDLLSASQITTQPACFHHLPEQVEPMNLSTSCKSQIPTTTGLDGQNSEDDPEVCSSQNSQSVGISEGMMPEAVQETHKDISVLNLNDTTTDVPQTVLPHLSLSSCIVNVNHSVHNSAIALATLAEEQEREVCSVSRRPDCPAASQTLSDSDLLPSNLQSQVMAEAASPHTDTKDCCSLIDQSATSPVKSSHSSRNESSIAEKSSSVDCQTCEVEKSTTGSSQASQESSVFMEKETASKSKRLPKKRVEIPMDDKSRDERTTRYSLTIDDVIANFVYEPEPLEEFSLTEEEEAAIRDQFENIPGMGSKVHTDINANQSKQDQVSNKTDPLDQPELDTTGEKLSTSSGTINLVTSSKKCPETIAATDETTDEYQEGRSTVENIDNVLAFVAGDVFNSMSLVSVVKSADNKKQTKSIRKLKKIEAGNKNGKENKVLTSGDVLAGEGSLCITNTKQEFSSAEGDRPDVLVSDGVSDNGQLAKDANVILKPRKPKKKKSVGMCGKPAELVQPDAADKSAVTEAKDDLSQAPEKQLLTARKETKGSLRVSKTRKSSERGAVFAAAVAGQLDVAADKDIVGLSRAETSDIGESLASTSGGSEQDTPVHELETKDELTSADLQPAENRDTGLESDEDAGKPVRRYKKRLDFVKCDHCDHQSRGRSALSRHMKKVHMLDISMPYKCQHCDYGCTKMASLNRHLFTHGVFPCSRCSHVADDRIKLTQHIVEDHRDKLNMKLCKMCNRYIKCDQVTIEQHSQQCRGPAPFSCTECDKVFRYASSLRVHYHTHFPSQPKRFGCEQCDYSTNYKANLHKHQKNMHACRDRDVQCPDCNKLFSTHDNMRRHRKVHTLVRPYACQTCEKTFKTQGALRGHQLIHTAIRPYMCNITGCNRSFRTSKFMKNHQEEFHRLAPKKFFCPVEGCNYSFFKRSHLKRHAITHTGERNFHCTWPGCSKSFRHSDNLKVHFRAHTNDKPIRCHMCDFKCKQLNSLFWHKKKVHHVFDIMAYPKRTDHKLAETTNAVKTAKLDTDCSQATPGAAGLEPEDEGNSQILSATEAESEVVGGQVAFVAVNSESSKCQKETAPVVLEKATLSVGVEASDEAAENPAGVVGEAEVKGSLFTRTEETKLVPCDQSVGTQTAIREPGLLDLYEFKSDDESDEETPGQFRRDKNMLTVLTPLPPPPKELLHRIELQEMKEKEKREKAEKKEQEKKEKAEKKDQERKEKVEKKELEKKEKAERKELEQIERIRKKELEKKEKLEKKELEKKEKEDQKLSEIKEKIEKKEMEKKDKVGKKELEKKEKLEKKEQAKKEKLERKEQERREKIEKKEQETKQKQGKQEQEKKGKEQQVEVNKATTEKLKNVGKKKTAGNRMASEEQVTDDTATKKSPKRLQRNKSPVAVAKSNSLVRSEMYTRSKRKLTTDNSDVSKAETDCHGPGESPDVGISSPKRRKVATRRMEESTPVLSPRADSVGKAASVKKNAPAEVKKKDKLLPKRKPSARIQAKKKATVKEGRKIPKASKVTLRNKPGRKKSVSQVKEIVEETQENKTEVEVKVEDNVVVKVSEEKEVAAAESQEETVILLQKPLSPAYSEEMMLQGSASPYRGLSDGENLEDDETEVDETQDQSPSPVLPQEQSHAQNKSEADSDLLSSDKIDSFAMDRNVSQTVDDYSDNEVSIDIPLTPPRAPAPPPVESSEDEMEPEPTPFSVPGPTTPFSVPAPNTPFSVPPPTNLMQQHSVHSDEATVSALPSVASVEVHSQASVDMQQPLGSVEMHPHGSVEMSHPHGSAEMHHPHGSVEMHHPHGSVEMHHPHGSVEMNHPHGSVEIHPHGSLEMNHLHGSVEMHHSQGSVEMSLPHGSAEMVQSLNSLEGQHLHRSVSESMTHSEQTLSSIRTPESVIRDSNSNSLSEKYDLLPHSLQEQVQTSDADKEYFDQYLKSLSAANNRAANGGLGPCPSGLQQLEAMVCKSHLLDSRELNSKSPISSLPISVITSLENSLSLLPHGDLRSRMDALVSDRHESLYARDTPSSLARLPDHQIPLANHPCPTPSYDTFSPLTPLHPSATNSGRDSSYLRQPEKLFPTPPGSSSFMAEAMFQRQAMTTPFLPPHSDKSSLSRVPDTTHLRSSSSSSLLRRPGTVPASDMFSSPTMTQAVPRHPFANTWAGQEMRPAHWQPPYLPRQPNMPTTGSFFPTKESYLTGRNFMFDPSIRPAADRNMFSSLSTQSQDSFQLDRFDLSNYFPNAMTPYGSSSGSFDYSRSVHTSATKPFDDRYRQTSTSAAISDFRGLPSSSGSADMFSGLPSVNSSFNIYPGSPMGYHAQHMPDNVNSAFLAHPATSQHAMFERDYASTAHRGLYPQNTPYSFLDERQYAGASKLAHAHPVAPAAVPQERNLMSRSATADSQMQDPYRSMLYRY